MIPKKIHYIWLGGNPLPELTLKCIESWKKFCPDYEIIEWNESNFDISTNEFCRLAYENKKYAFASDYVRLYVLEKHGGVYMDTDVEVVKPIDEFMDNQAFSGFEKVDSIPTGIMACEAHYRCFKELLDEYNSRAFVLESGRFNLTPNVKYFTDYFLKLGLNLDNQEQNISGFHLYPTEYFCPKDYVSEEYSPTENTFTIHHFMGSWVTKTQKKIAKVKAAYRIKYGKKCKIMFVIFHPILAVKYLRGMKK